MPPLCPPELLTPRDFLRYAVSRFRAAKLEHAHGVTNAHDEAAFIVLEGLHLPVDRLDPYLDARLTAAERERLAGLIEARIETRKPACYLLNAAYIGPFRFYVDERVIVPRSFIGELLLSDDFDTHLASLGDGEPFDLGAATEVLDLCTGSGCLAIVAAHLLPDAQVDAADLSQDALAVARRNIDEHNLSGRIQAIQSDLFLALKGRRYDLIISNPPYVPETEVAAFPPEFAAEPVMAHLGGGDGMDLVRRIIRKARPHLKPGGGLLCEIGLGRDVIEAEFPAISFNWLDTAESNGEVFWLRREYLPVK